MNALGEQIPQKEGLGRCNPRLLCQGCPAPNGQASPAHPPTHGLLLYAQKEGAWRVLHSLSEHRGHLLSKNKRAQGHTESLTPPPRPPTWAPKFTVYLPSAAKCLLRHRALTAGVHCRSKWGRRGLRSQRVLVADVHCSLCIPLQHCLLLAS